jgi:DNA repair protein RadC
MEKLSIKQWAEEDRPREKLLLKGAPTLSDSELLAILIGSGNDRETAVELSKRILQKADNDLHKLGRLEVTDFIDNFRGIGAAKAVTIVAALELGKRRKETEKPKREKITSSTSAYNILFPMLADLAHEEVWALLLDSANQVIAPIQVSKGGISTTVIDNRLILREALNRYATSIILAHNHPSGSCKPSPQDMQTTKKLKEAARCMDILLYDHLVIAEKEFFSFADNNLI